MKLNYCNFVILVVLILLTIGAAGCKDQNAPRSRLHITRIAETDVELETYDYVFLSDVSVGETETTPGTVFEDEVYVTVRNEARSDLLSLNSGGVFGSVTLTDYTVEYGIEDEYIKPINSSMHLTVGNGEERIAKIVLVTAVSKIHPPLSTLVFEPEELLVHAKITLRGYEETSHESVSVVAYVDVHFANWSDSTD